MAGKDHIIEFVLSKITLIMIIFRITWVYIYLLEIKYVGHSTEILQKAFQRQKYSVKKLKRFSFLVFTKILADDKEIFFWLLVAAKSQKKFDVLTM